MTKRWRLGESGFGNWPLIQSGGLFRALTIAAIIFASGPNADAANWTGAGWYQLEFLNILNIGDDYGGLDGGPFSDKATCDANLPVLDPQEQQAGIFVECDYLTEDPDKRASGNDSDASQDIAESNWWGTVGSPPQPDGWHFWADGTASWGDAQGHYDNGRGIYHWELHGSTLTITQPVMVPTWRGYVGTLSGDTYAGTVDRTSGPAPFFFRRQ